MRLHVTSPEEQRDSLARLQGAATVLIPNGVETPSRVDRVPRADALRLLYLGRLHPIKGIKNLLDACDRLPAQDGEWSLDIAGDGEPDYTSHLREYIAFVGIANKVRMHGQVAGERKEALLARADLLVVPSFTENFGMVVAEALARSVPVIASTGSPWHRLDEVGCGWWVNNHPDTLAAAISRARRTDLDSMGRRGREWMLQEFCWVAIADRMRACYEELAQAPEAGTGWWRGLASSSEASKERA
jgi:glycosyltransferase involved in cell wall biosynthesis